MLTLIRDISYPDTVMGRLELNGQMICYTLENARKLIPCGMYSMQNSRSQKFKRELPLLFSKDVSASRGIRIHRGNSVKDSSGCVLVGMGRNTDCLTITESTPAETMVTMLCRNCGSLVIVDE